MYQAVHSTICFCFSCCYLSWLLSENESSSRTGNTNFKCIRVHFSNECLHLLDIYCCTSCNQHISTPHGRNCFTFIVQHPLTPALVRPFAFNHPAWTCCCSTLPADHFNGFVLSPSYALYSCCICASPSASSAAMPSSVRRAGCAWAAARGSRATATCEVEK